MGTAANHQSAVTVVSPDFCDRFAILNNNIYFHEVHVPQRSAYTRLFPAEMPPMYVRVHGVRPRAGQPIRIPHPGCWYLADGSTVFRHCRNGFLMADGLTIFEFNRPDYPRRSDHDYQVDYTLENNLIFRCPRSSLRDVGTVIHEYNPAWERHDDSEED